MPILRSSSLGDLVRDFGQGYVGLDSGYLVNGLPGLGEHPTPHSTSGRLNYVIPYFICMR
ncbi:hypothetical protein DM860_017798 [Cuscuta australis]|uniref:Uncharacterized protein n=1 Tax=Cuscuta australis TaxID=267555 RepID=A0A328DV46_9ASTE|nr:hypothetical protein DM860_017798 [Cuscuta australis]